MQDRMVLVRLGDTHIHDDTPSHEQQNLPTTQTLRPWHNHPIRSRARSNAAGRNAGLLSLLFGRLWGARNFCREINFAKVRLIGHGPRGARDAQNAAGLSMVKTPAGKVGFAKVCGYQ
jgi:hypothetical protein